MYDLLFNSPDALAIREAETALALPVGYTSTSSGGVLAPKVIKHANTRFAGGPSLILPGASLCMCLCMRGVYGS